MCTGFSFSFLMFHRVMTRVNDATNSSSIRLWYPIPFYKFGLLSRRLRREGELQLLREKNISQRGKVELRLFLQEEVELQLFLRGKNVSRRGGQVAVVFAR